MKMTKINTALATTGIVASVANGAPLNGGSQVDLNPSGITKGQGQWISIHPDPETTGLPVSRFPGGPRKGGPCKEDCDVKTSSVLDDEISTTKVVIDPLVPIRSMGTPATTYTNIFTVGDETTKTTTAAQAKTTSSDIDMRIPSNETQRVSIPHIVFVTTTSSFETSVSKTSEAAAMPTLINPLLPPWEQPEPILSSVVITVPEPVLTTIYDTTSSALPEPVLTTIHETTSSALPEPVLTTIHETTSSALPEPVLTTIHETTSSTLPGGPGGGFISFITTSEATSTQTQTQTPSETSAEVVTELETVLATATQYVTPAPVEQTFTTVTTAHKEDKAVGHRA